MCNRYVIYRDKNIYCVIHGINIKIALLLTCIGIKALLHFVHSCFMYVISLKDTEPDIGKYKVTDTKMSED